MEPWQRNFLAVWPSLLVVTVGLMGVIPALPLYLEERFGLVDPGEVESWTAVVFGAAPLTAALCGPFWGALGDRVGRKAMLIRAQLGIGVALALMPLAPDPATLTGLRVLQGLFAGFVAPAMALVTSSAPDGRQGQVIARLQLALAFGLAIGPGLAAEVAALASREAVFWCSSGLAFASMLPVLFLVREDRSLLLGRHPVPGPTVWDVLRNRVLLVTLGLVFLMRFGLHMVEPFTALWVRELGALEWLAPADAILAVDRTTALAFTILAVGQLLATTRWGRAADRFGPLRCLALVALGLAVVLALISRVTSVEAYLGLRGAAALFMAGTMTLAYAAIGRRVHRAHRSLAFGLVQSCMQLGISLGPMFGSGLARTTGLRGLFVVAAATLLAAATGMLLLRRTEGSVGPAPPT